jgi:hypothetical protein
MIFLGLSSVPIAWALEAARIFFVVCRCVVSEFGMSYRRG